MIREFATDGGNVRHQANFIDAIRRGDRAVLNSDVETGHLSSTWCNLANICYCMGDGDWNQASKAYGDSSLWLDAIASVDKVLNREGLKEQKAQMQFSEVLQFDARVQRFHGADAEAANRLLKSEYREPFLVPDLT